MLRDVAKKIWLDPVWSKVIATGIIAVVSTVAWLVNTYSNNRVESPQQLSYQDIIYRNITTGYCGKPRDYRKVVNLIPELPTEEARQSEMSSLIEDAVCAGDELFAFEYVSKLTITHFKDKVARHAAEVHINAKRYEQARKWVSLLTDPQDREWWIQRVFRESTQ